MDYDATALCPCPWWCLYPNTLGVSSLFLCVVGTGEFGVIAYRWVSCLLLCVVGIGGFPMPSCFGLLLLGVYLLNC